MADVGYIRVSSVGQNTDRQLDGVKLDHTFSEKISGKSTERPKLQECLRFLRVGDTLHVHSMDRLARNLKDLQQMVEDLTARGVMVQFHKEHLTFTNDTNPMSKLMLQIMGAVAEFERSLIKERQLEGIKKALEKGVQFGRQQKLSDTQKKELIAMINTGKNKKDVAEHFEISRPTLYKILKSV